MFCSFLTGLAARTFSNYKNTQIATQTDRSNRSSRASITIIRIFKEFKNRRVPEPEGPYLDPGDGFLGLHHARRLGGLTFADQLRGAQVLGPEEYALDEHCAACPHEERMSAKGLGEWEKYVLEIFEKKYLGFTEYMYSFYVASVGAGACLCSFFVRQVVRLRED